MAGCDRLLDESVGDEGRFVAGRLRYALRATGG